MARHRNIRSMNYTDEYDGYDDVYGHSVEEDYCMSPTDAAFIYDRESSNSQHIGAFFKDIAEEDEPEQESATDLAKVDRTKLQSGVDQMKMRLGSSISQQEMEQALVNNNFDVERAINYLLDNQKSMQTKLAEKKEKDVNVCAKSPKFSIPKLSKFDTKLVHKFTNLNIQDSEKYSVGSSNLEHTKGGFASLADLTNSHLQNVSFQAPSIFGRQNETVLKKSVRDVSKTFSNLNLIPVASSTDRIEGAENTQNEFKIDLSKAIKTTRSAPFIRKKSIDEVDEIGLPFIECDIAYDKPIDTNFCSMDITFVAREKYSNTKKVSSFGRVLCRKYKRHNPFVITSTKREIIFSFNSLSPDDIIKGSLRRK